jgi:hypothetical protein
LASVVRQAPGTQTKSPGQLGRGFHLFINCYYEIEVAYLGCTKLGHNLKLGFEVVEGAVSEGGTPVLGVVIGDVVADF